MAPPKSQKFNRHQRLALAEWRGVDEPADLTGYEHGLAELLAKFLKNAGYEDRVTEEDLAPIWNAAVGDFIGQHSRALSWENGILYVAVLQPSVHYTLQRELRSKILPKLKSALPGKVIRDIKLRLG